MRLGVFTTGNIEIGAFFTAHSDSVILAGLTPADQVSIIAFYPAPFDMLGTINRAIDNLIPLSGIVVIVEFHSGDDVVGTRLVQCRSRAFDENLIRTVGELVYGGGEGIVKGSPGIVTMGTERKTADGFEPTAAVRARGVVLCHV